jgi:YHS domain-containing protein
MSVPLGMIRYFVIRILLPLLLFLFLRAVLRSIFAGSRSLRPRDTAGKGAPVPAAGELKKDPVCGTYVSTAASVTRTVNGRVIHFCSDECRDKYRVA